MVTWFAKLSAEKKNLFILCAVSLLVFLILLPLFLIDQESWAFGWLLGSAIGAFSYYTIVLLAKSVVTTDRRSGGVWVGIAFFALRFLLYSAALVVSAICTFKPEWFGGFGADGTGFNFWATAIGFLPMPLLVAISHLIESRKQGKPKKEGAEPEKAEAHDEPTEGKE
jgi:predicted ABC-type exoprotein transport system permease subunit